VITSSSKEDVLLKGIYDIANEINKDQFLSSQIVQVYCNKKGGFELIPRIGNHRVIFGSAENVDLKFKKLKSFYTKGINIKELNLYDTLNIMYNTQIVCSKR
jgi:cell division protein FtsQ